MPPAGGSYTCLVRAYVTPGGANGSEHKTSETANRIDNSPQNGGIDLLEIWPDPVGVFKVPSSPQGLVLSRCMLKLREKERNHIVFSRKFINLKPSPTEKKRKKKRAGLVEPLRDRQLIGYGIPCAKNNKAQRPENTLIHGIRTAAPDGLCCWDMAIKFFLHTLSMEADA